MVPFNGLVASFPCTIASLAPDGGDDGTTAKAMVTVFLEICAVLSFVEDAILTSGEGSAQFHFRSCPGAAARDNRFDPSGRDTSGTSLCSDPTWRSGKIWHPSLLRCFGPPRRRASSRSYKNVAHIRLERRPYLA